MASPSEDLQKAVRDFLLADPDISVLVGSRVYDGVPEEPGNPYVAFGSSDYADDRANCIDGLRETLQIDVWYEDQARLRRCKALTWLIWSKLQGASLSLATHALADLNVFLAKVEADPDGITAHGVVQITADLEVVN